MSVRNFHLYSPLDAHAEEDLRGRPTQPQPLAVSSLPQALIWLNSTCPWTSFPCISPAEFNGVLLHRTENGVKMTNEPPKAAVIVSQPLCGIRLHSSLYS